MLRNEYFEKVGLPIHTAGLSEVHLLPQQSLRGYNVKKNMQVASQKYFFLNVHKLFCH